VTRLRDFGLFWWDFVVGDDWRAALGIALALGIAAALVATGIDAWWLVPIGVVAILFASLRREAEKARRV